MASSINAIRMIAQNPSRVDPYECYQEIVPEYIKDKDSVEVQKVFDDLFSFNDGLDQEQRRYLREGLENEDQLAVFDLLQKDTLTKPDREQINAGERNLHARQNTNWHKLPIIYPAATKSHLQ